jgi:murein DD-endopeptidase MepM/ murein hydrolase activator NlpD
VKRASFFAGLFLLSALPLSVEAGVFSSITDLFSKNKGTTTEARPVNSQNMNLLQAAVNPDPNPAKGGGDITVVGGTALLSEDGPSGTALEVEEHDGESSHISLYVVRPGDSLSTIAKLFNVSKNTIAWANDIKGGTVKPGDTLVILPVSGVRHTIVKGDSLKSLAKKYKADAGEIAQYNSIADDSELVIGDTIIVPDGEIAAPPVSKTVGGKTVFGTNPWRKSASGPLIENYYIRPITGGVKTQGLHGYNGVDLASYMGAPIMASASGVVIISRTSGWNAGYGNYIVIKHDNGTQTLYGHLSKNLVGVGEVVTQGQVIGQMGRTGKATGVHVHFEIRGAANPF